MKLLKQLYGIHSPSGQERRIRLFIESYVVSNIPTAQYTIDKVGNIFITKGEAESFPCVVAHLDQVQRHHSKDFRAVETRDIIFGYSPSKREREGLGADDKNGIWVALQCLKKYDAIKVAFFVGEEIGCVGSSAADLTFFQDCRFVIQPDRRGYRDVITQISGVSICSEEFITDMRPELFGYTQHEGIMTDVEALRDNGLALSCINVSCGYYEPHTDDEFTVKKDLLNCLRFIQHIIENCTKVYHHEVNLDVYNHHLGNRYSIFDNYDYYINMMHDIVTSHPGYTLEDLWDVYSVNFPELSEDEFGELYDDYILITEEEQELEPEPDPIQLKLFQPTNKKSKKQTKKKRSSQIRYSA